MACSLVICQVSRRLNFVLSPPSCFSGGAPEKCKSSFPTVMAHPETVQEDIAALDLTETHERQIQSQVLPVNNTPPGLNQNYSP